MVETRTANSEELEKLLEFEKKYTERDDSLEEFREKYEKWPELFVVCRDSKELIGEASGTVRDGEVILESIAVREDYRGEGFGKSILEFFEKQARNYSDRVSVATADNVEEFYRRCGYRPEKILLQVNRSDLPENYRKEERLVDERDIGSEIKFLYVEFDNYSAGTRNELKENFNAFEANTIYEKELS